MVTGKDETLADKVANTRRQVRVTVPQWVIQQVCMTGEELHIRVVKGIPQTADFVREYYDTRSGDVVFVFRDDSFEVVPEGEAVPVFHQIIELIAIKDEGE